MSAKTTTPISVRSALVARALIQSTLDASVSGISPGFALSASDGSFVEIDAVLSHADGRSALTVGHPGSKDADRDTFACDLAERGLRLLSLHEDDVLREPYATNADLVWAAQGAPFSASDQIRVLLFLAEFGPSPIVDLASASSSGDALTSIMAMCCRGIIDLDLRHRPLGPYTQASCRPYA